ncbi:hypothetical protein V7148_21815 [Gottfriedia acidiceleris]|uniref:hypothetical protein n=1 Tax=Bacillaceae TaxID=186817 RepID=UPI000BECC390|nr:MULTISPECIES: hypothetical protein [unclassified Bacillus (in: firmicutes)]PEC47820.1 hypothetical protein CON00_19370 [Bacillus sp. AFS096315]PFM74445.1 hypothetical protein COJ46_23755 [Bacillus sp. AFS077874]
MKKEFAISISNQIKNWIVSNNSLFNIEEIPTTFNTLQNFQQWTNGKPIVSAFHLSKVEEESYYLLLIDWHRNDNFYLVIYVENKSTTAAEIREIREQDGQFSLVWKYNPLKRDGKNAERKAYFKQVFGSLQVEIPIPSTPNEVERFFNDLYKLCRNRQTADRIIDLYDI